MNVYFSGMIGSGKTTLGERVARDLRLEFFDLDREMDRRLGYSFHRLVHEKGWLPFRELEYSICKFFAGLTDAVICLGGGTVRYEWNIDVLRPTGVFILLDVPLSELVRRVRTADRPRVNEGVSLEEDISIIWEKGKHRYYGTADIVLASGQKSVDQETAEIETLILGDSRFSALRVARPGR